MPPKQKSSEAQNPLILRSHRLMEAFAKSDDERDFYLDKIEGFIVYVNLDKSGEELNTLYQELETNKDRYCIIPKLTFFETKKIMEGFVNEKVYDIDTKEKLLDIIQSREAREHFLEFIYDHHSELEKWQQYYQERSRIRIIEWLRNYHFHFVFEEDLDLSTKIIEKLKENLFETDVAKEIEVARKSLFSKAKTYYSNEALNPRPKRGRPPKQAQKLEMEPQVTTDIYTTVPSPIRPFLFTPEISSVFDVTFSSKFETGQELLAQRRQTPESADYEGNLNNISQQLATLRQLSSKWMENEKDKDLIDNKEVPAEKKEHLLNNTEKEDSLLSKKLEKRKTATKSNLKSTASEKKEKPIEAVLLNKAENDKSKTKAKKSLPKPQTAATKKRIIAQNNPTDKKQKASSSKTPEMRHARKITPKSQSTKSAEKRPLRKTKSTNSGKKKK